MWRKSDGLLSVTNVFAFRVLSQQSVEEERVPSIPILTNTPRGDHEMLPRSSTMIRRQIRPRSNAARHPVAAQEAKARR